MQLQAILSIIIIMDNCKSICFVEDCSKTMKYYVNYSRYHGVCTSHKSFITENRSEFCRRCGANVKIFSELEHRSRLEYDKHIRLLEDSNNTQ